MTATYRLQLGPGLSFTAAAALVDYLHDLGVDEVYSSPIATPRRGSTHGYDVADPSRINPEIGGEGGFRALTTALSRRGMGLLLDIVPNHMAATGDNPWWRDVLENGRNSPYAEFFDIDWESTAAGRPNRVLIPILGDSFRNVVENGELGLVIDADGIHVAYYEARFPIAPETYDVVLAPALAALERESGPDHPASRALRRLLARVRRLAAAVVENEAGRPAPSRHLRAEKATVKRALSIVRRRHAGAARQLDRVLRLAHGSERGIRRATELLDDLMARQHYRPCFWRRASTEVNYRRFFNVSDLVAVRVERARVFEARHELIGRLVREGRIQRLRIDHIDGLYDPAGYLARLRRHVGRGVGIVVEKILVGGDALREDWPVEGTTGYEFLETVGGVFVDPDGARALRDAWHRLSGSTDDFETVAHRARKQVAAMHFVGEFRSLARQLAALSPGAFPTKSDEELLFDALIEVASSFPVYRTYVDGPRPAEADRVIVRAAVAAARRRAPVRLRAALTAVRRALLLENLDRARADRRRAGLEFVRRWQQITGVLMAKGVEDTAFYRWNRLISLNEVGGEPDRDGVSPDRFHARMRERAELWPSALSATATHDTKRGEDARMRIHTLTEFPRAWETLVRRWHRLNQPRSRTIRGRRVPTPAEEALFYQTLVGVWPVGSRGTAELRHRVRSFMLKAAREAKEHTSWLHPDALHESALFAFVDAALDPTASNGFLDDFVRFHATVADAAIWSSLSQTLLKIAAPGRPDFYQGSEWWDCRMVDPDNRRPVRFGRRRAALAEIVERDRRNRPALLASLLARRDDGRIKMFLIWKALAARRADPRLFSGGDYLPLRFRGPMAERLVGFARVRGRSWAMAVAPRLIGRATVGGRRPLGREFWGASALAIPRGAPSAWTDAITGREIDSSGRRPGALEVGDVLAEFPVALLRA